MNSTQIPPQALDMEAAVLGACLLEAQALDIASGILRSEMLYTDQHRAIFQAITALYSNSQPVDLLTVKNHMQKAGTLSAAGGVGYLADLTSMVASAANVEYHSRVIVEKWMLRQVIELSTTAQRAAYRPDADCFELLDTISSKLFGLADRSSSDGTMLSDAITDTLQHLQHIAGIDGDVTGIGTPLRCIDRLTTGWQDGDLIILAARPSMGKTAFALTSALAAARSGHHVAFFSLEMNRRLLVQRLLAQHSQLPGDLIRRGRLNQEGWERLNTAAGDLEQLPVQIFDGSAWSLPQLIAKLRRLKKRHNLRLAVIDYLQLVDGIKARGGSREQEIASISRGLKKAARELDLPIILLSQLSRAVEQRAEKRPILSDLRESGAIEQDADVVLFLYRPEYYGLKAYEDGSSTRDVCEVIISKQRNGPTATERVIFQPDRQRWADMEAAGITPMGKLPGSVPF